MQLELEGRRALVTGSTRGLGRAIAVTLADEGCRVIVNGRDQGDAERVADQLGRGASALAADVTSAQECSDLMARATESDGRLDVLVCNVGSGRSVPPGSETPEEWERVFALNFRATTNMVAAATESLASARGTVVCISSICGLETLGAPVTYSAAKAALNSYVRGIARPLARKGVRINAVAPGNLLFPGSVWDTRMRSDPAAVGELLQREVALGRLGTPEEIAAFVAFLASPRAAFATGSVYVVDGGQLRS